MNNSTDSVKTEGVPSSGRPFFSDSVCTAILLIAAAPRWRGAYSRCLAVGLLVVIVVASLPAITMFKQAKVRKRPAFALCGFC